MTPRCMRHHFAGPLAALLWVLVGALPATAQFPDFGRIGGSPGGGGEKVEISAEFTTADGDRPAVLFVTAEIAPEFHINAVDQAPGGPQATSISLPESTDYRQLFPFRPIEPPESHIDEEIWVGLELREHEGRVTWFAPIEIADGVDPESLSIEGTIQGQACADVCIPFESTFAAQLGQGVELPEGVDLSPVDAGDAPASVAPTAPADGGEAVDSASRDPSWQVEKTAESGNAPYYDLEKIELQETDESLLYYLALAFAGGIILNVMPCVLPVIGLKVMSFVQQAGESRARAWALNLWYSIGIVAVFLALAALAVFMRLGWGEQFGSPAFNVTLVGIVFAMALSLLGLWEIPIPGFVGSGAAVEMAEREGPVGALLKGGLTTVLATPCIGPFMTTALTWAMKQPATTTFSVFAMLGLGMASPYLLIGAFPRLIRFIPKPGPWMETFKKLMGLILLATVVWLLTFLEPAMVVPTVALMVGIAAACWWVAQTPVTAPLSTQAYAWTTAALAVAIVAMGSYGWLYQDVMLQRFDRRVDLRVEQALANERLSLSQTLANVGDPQQLAALRRDLIANSALADAAWQPFTLERLAQLAIQQKRTVLVDFTADWCMTCKTLEAAVLKTDEVEAAINEADVVTMVADYTDTPEWMSQTIYALGGVGVPVVAIFPADDPYRPIVFPSGYTKQKLLAAIKKATGRQVTQTARFSGEATPR